MDAFEKLDAEVRKRHLANRMLLRFVEKPQLLDDLIKALEAPEEDFVEWGEFEVDDAVQV